MFTLIGLFIVVPIITAGILRACRVPGWFAIAGMLAGLLVGPSVLGNTFPTWYRSVMNGSADAYEALRLHDRAYERTRMASRAAGLDVDQLLELDEARRVQRVPLEAALEESIRSHRVRHRAIMAVLVVIALLAAGPLRVQGARRDEAIRIGWAGPLGIGLWAALTPAILAFGLACWLIDASTTTALWTAAAVAIGPWALTRDDRHAAVEAEAAGDRTVQRAGMVASLAALVGIATCAAIGDVFAPVWALVLLAHPLSWFLPAQTSDDSRVRWRGRAELLVLPPLITTSIATVDVVSSFHIWFIIVVMLLSGDGRWQAAVIGAQTLGGRRGLLTMRLTLGMMSCGATQFAVLAVGVSIEALDGRSAVAIALAAMMLDVLSPARRHVARELRQVDEAQDDESP